MIYGDMECTALGKYGNRQIPAPVGAATTERQYWAHWKYNREDAGLRRLLSSTAYYAVWDDHEVMNDFGPHDDWHRYAPYTIGAHLLPLGRHALFDYNPIREDPSNPTRLYRSFRFGRHVELVLLDTRSYRDPNWDKDDGPAPKTMLGAEQRRWFEDTITQSDATWKVVVSSVPISIPTGRGTPEAGHDGWASYDLDVGYERELEALFARFRDAHVRNLLFLTTDVHFATAFTYRPFPGTPDFLVYEVTAGPLGAQLLPTERVDDTFHPTRLFFHGPMEPVKSFADATRFMNWGKVSVDRTGDLTVSIIGGDGKVAALQRLDRAAEGSSPSKLISSGALVH
jgi:alkaline phosphatase D